MTQPLVSVVMPVWNRADRVAEAVRSILAQSYETFEFIVVDDGSTDTTLEVLRAFDSPKLRVVPLPANCGVPTARTIGHRCARGDYIAVMDSDDVAFADRLAVQVAFMQAHPDIALCGTSAVKLFPDGQKRPMAYPEHDPQIKAMLLNVDGVVIHPTAMIRASFLRDHNIWYEAAYTTDDDNALFLEIARAGGRFVNLRDRLLRYTRHDGNVTAPSRSLESRKTPLRERVIAAFFPTLDQHDVRALAALMERGRHWTFEEACLGIGVAAKAVLDRRSYLGEDKALVARLIGHAVMRVKQTFVKSLVQ